MHSSKRSTILPKLGKEHTLEITCKHARRFQDADGEDIVVHHLPAVSYSRGDCKKQLHPGKWGGSKNVMLSGRESNPGRPRNGGACFAE